MAFCQLTLTRVAIVAALAYLGYNLLSFYTIFYPPQCPNDQLIQRCIVPAHTKDKKLEVSGRFKGQRSTTMLWGGVCAIMIDPKSEFYMCT